MSAADRVLLALWRAKADAEARYDELIAEREREADRIREAKTRMCDEYDSLIGDVSAVLEGSGS